jgi:hypothetical protein
MSQDGAVRLGDLLLLELTWYYLFDLVLETERDLGDFFRINGWGRESLAAP